MKILVTGGAGFIGSHLCQRLVSQGESVCILDNLSDFYDRELKTQNLACVGSCGEFRFVNVTIVDAASVLFAVRAFRPDAIVHLAAQAGVRPSINDPLFYENVNIRGTLVVLEAARHAGVSQFVFASSSSVYGATDRVPFREETVPSPISPYAATKLAAEALCGAYSRLFGFAVCCLRLFTVYGPRQRPDLAICRFMNRILRAEPIHLFGDGTSARDYTYVDDIVDGILSALSLGTGFEVLNLGSSSPVTLLQMVRAIETALGTAATIEWRAEQSGDVPVTYADITKAKRLLGYSPKTSFAEGVRRQAQWLLAQPPWRTVRTMPPEPIPLR